MSKGMALRGHEQRMVFELTSALTASFDLRAVLKDAYRLLLPLVGADYGALATSRSDRPEEFEWIVQELPPAFLGSYREMAPHDFVRNSVLVRINEVVRDSEMIDRRSLERNMMYHRAQELGSPLEQVMAVMLHAGSGFQSGLSLYRAKRRPFTEREQRILQQLAPMIGNTVRNCQMFATQERRGVVLEKLLASEERAVLVVRPSAREIDRTARATTLLEAWFPAIERCAGGLPRSLHECLVAAQTASAKGRVGPWMATLRGERADLEVEVFPVSEPGGATFWVLVLDEGPRTPRLPESLESGLAHRERQVVAALLNGWSNEVIALELGCKLNTVKTHVRNVYDKLGVDGRKKLQYLAMRRK